MLLIQIYLFCIQRDIITLIINKILDNILFIMRIWTRILNLLITNLAKKMQKKKNKLNTTFLFHDIYNYR